MLVAMAIERDLFVIGDEATGSSATTGRSPRGSSRRPIAWEPGPGDPDRLHQQSVLGLRGTIRVLVTRNEEILDARSGSSGAPVPSVAGTVAAAEGYRLARQVSPP
jgi:hypothetical protein